MEEGGSLVLTETLQTDEGVYVCTASNMVGTRTSPPAILAVLGELRVRVCVCVYEGREACTLIKGNWGVRCVREVRGVYMKRRGIATVCLCLGVCHAAGEVCVRVDCAAPLCMRAVGCGCFCGQVIG